MKPSRSMLLLFISTCGFLVLTSDHPVAQSRCEQLLTDIDRQNNSESFEEAARTLDRMVASGTCDEPQIKTARKRLSNALLRSAAKLQDDLTRSDSYRDLLRQAVGYHTSWQAAWRLGDFEMKQRAFTKAASQFQAAIELLTDTPPSERDSNYTGTGKYLMARADEARHLAASESSASGPTFVAAVRSLRSVGPGGVYNRSFRGIDAIKVPPPITFIYDKAEFTEVGRQAAEELVQVLGDRNPGRISVTGHTDKRGLPAYNLSLSQRRAEAVVSYLKSKHVQATYVAEGKGFGDPRKLSDSTSYTQDEIDALNRRVEIDWKAN